MKVTADVWRGDEDGGAVDAAALSGLEDLDTLALPLSCSTPVSISLSTSLQLLAVPQ